jgi:cytochrome c oxidase subunit 2
MKRLWPAVVLLGGCLLSGCEGAQSAANPAGRHAELTAGLFLTFLGVTGAFLLAVIGLLALAAQRRGSPPSEQTLARALRVWGGAIVVGLFILTLASYFTDRELASFASTSAPSSLRIKITAQQWWWDVEYLSADPSQRFHTANELHLPQDVRAHIELTSDDVIHSFWLPNLAGKQDLIPGRTTDIDLLPTRAGVFRGQCAEFCGMEHALMALEVKIETPEAFAQWREASLRPAREPLTALEAAGRDYFMAHQCVACHTIGGTGASGAIGPDLTHFASRRSIAAGSLPNTLGHLEGWIADPQTLKPGNRMPVIDIAPADLHAVSAYLASLT